MGKLVGVEEEKFEKSYKLKMWHQFQIQNFSTFKDGRLTSNLGLKCWVFWIFVYKGFSIIFFVLQKSIYNSKKKTKKVFFTEIKLPTERKCKKCCKEKRCKRAILEGAEKLQMKVHES